MTTRKGDIYCTSRSSEYQFTLRGIMRTRWGEGGYMSEVNGCWSYIGRKRV